MWCILNMSISKTFVFLVLLSSSAFSQNIPSIDVPPGFDGENDPTLAHRSPRNLTTVKYGMTWGYRGYTPDAQETFGVHCYGTPTVPIASPWNSADGGCNAYQGDTPCSAKLPILCINKGGYNRPCYTVNCSPHAMNPEFYCGWAEGFIVLSTPVVGSTLTSEEAASAVCAAQFGPNFVIAEHHMGMWMSGMSSTSYCYNTWPLGHANGGGWGFYAYGVKGPSWTRFWVAIEGQPANCWG